MEKHCLGQRGGMPFEVHRQNGPRTNKMKGILDTTYDSTYFILDTWAKVK